MKSDIKFQIFGWVLFIICAFFFIAASWKNHDTLTLIGGIIFLVACFFFLIPLLGSGKNSGD